MSDFALTGFDYGQGVEADARTKLWPAVERLVARAPTAQDVRVHRLEPFAAEIWPAVGREVTHELADEARFAAVTSLVTPVILERVRAAYDGRIMVMKGPEVAVYYPRAELRAFRDVDLLVDDAQAAQGALLAAGFVEVGDPSKYEGIHHLRPLLLPGLPIALEVHSRPKWPSAEEPSVGTLLDAGEPGAAGVEGLLAPPPALHAVLLAAHSWAHEPLRRLRDLVDVAAVSAGCSAADVEDAAEELGIARIWRATRRVIDELLENDRVPGLVRPWAGHLARARERTVAQAHATAWLSGFWERRPAAAAWQLTRAIAHEGRREPGEPWRDKVVRTGLAVAHARYPRGRHETILDEFEV